MQTQNKSFRPAPFAPNSSFTGREGSFLLSAENMWVRSTRLGATFAEIYQGSQNLNETIPTQDLTGTLSFSPASQTVTGAGTSFVTELHLGQFVYAAGDLLVVEEIIGNTSFRTARTPTVTAAGATGKRLPVIFPVGTKRGTLLRGNVIQYPQGHYLGVGDGVFRLNGAALSASLTVDRKPRLLLYNPTTGLYTQVDVGISLTPLVGATPYITLSEQSGGLKAMPAAAYSIRVVPKASNTGGFGNPSEKATFTTTGAGKKLRITFNYAMNTAQGQDAYDIYASQFGGSTTTATANAFAGAWYLVETVTATQLATENGVPDGTVTGLFHDVEFADGEINGATGILTFDNFPPVDAEFVDFINGTPIYLSCQGKGTPTKKTGTSPGAMAIPSKPSNPEAVLLNKPITTALGDIIVGFTNVKGRTYALCQNTLQTLILTTLEEEPVTFRSLWNAGFRNPYNVCFVEDSLFGFTTRKIVRTGIDEENAASKFEFTSDIENYIKDWDAAYVLVGYCPKNNAVCFFYSAAEKRSDKWVTICLPFLLSRGVWNPPIIIQRSDRDMIVSGVATVGNHLEFLAGGDIGGGTIQIDTYRFDMPDSQSRNWHLAWTYIDETDEFAPETINGVGFTGKITSGKAEIHGVRQEGEINLTTLKNGHGIADKTVNFTNSAALERKDITAVDWATYSLWTMRLSGTCTVTSPNTGDRVDKLVVSYGTNSAPA